MLGLSGITQHISYEPDLTEALRAGILANRHAQTSATVAHGLAGKRHLETVKRYVSAEVALKGARAMTDEEKPNLLEDMFPHSLPPRILFTGKIGEEINGKLVEFDPNDAIERDLHITDTTFRDGQQSRPPYTVEQTVDLYKLLSRLSGPQGVVRMTEFFVYSKKDREAISAVKDLGYEYPRVTGWIRADKGDLSWVRKLDLPETGILTSCSDYHIFHKLGRNRETIMEQYLDVVRAALDAGIRPRCHLEDVTRADVDGFVVPFVRELAEISKGLPEEMKVKVRLCDTMGFGVTYPGASLPRSIPKLIYRITHDAGIPPERLEWHGHNDFHKVHINAVTTWLYGCNSVNATLLGFGERTGNPPLEAAIIEYISLRGDTCGIDTTAITDIADYFEKIGMPAARNYPFVGRDFNTTRAGIHAHGLSRDERVYNIFDTTTLLNRPPVVAITDKAGSDGVHYWVNSFLGLEGDERIKKTKLVKIMRWVKDQYDQGRTTAISPEEMEDLVRRYLPEHYERRPKS
jgi:isopropylmalate/homocitrate/citramalate synthase